VNPTEPTPLLPLTRVGLDDEVPPDLEPPEGPRYIRTAVHATGGMGTVWVARDTHLGREVALKELSRKGGPGATRFVREARITGQLEHPGVVPVYELGRDAETGRPFYVMRFIRGRTLTEVARAFHAGRRPGWYEPMELVRLLTAFVSVCDTIAYAHSRGVLHRDLKGGNIVLGEFGEAIVLDWGVAKRLDERDVPDPMSGTTETVTSAVDTRIGELVGTVAYMAPEQAAGRPDRIGPHTDVFGLGALLYEILTGAPPYPGGQLHDVLAQASERQVVPPRELWPDVPPVLEATCLRAMSRDPADRHPSAADLGREVQGWQDRQRRQAEDELRHAYDRLHRQQSALVALTRTEVFPGPDLETVLRRLVEGAARTLGVERVSVWRLSPDRRTLRCHILYELSPGRFSSGAELNAREYPDYFAALAATDVLAADDARTDPRTREFKDGYLVPLGIGAMMEVPIRPDGVLCHEHVGSPRAWLPDEELFGLAVGHLVAHAMSHWQAKGTAAPGL
jgi:serine/threonine protein kinase